MEKKWHRIEHMIMWHLVFILNFSQAVRHLAKAGKLFYLVNCFTWYLFHRCVYGGHLRHAVKNRGFMGHSKSHRRKLLRITAPHRHVGFYANEKSTAPRRIHFIIQGSHRPISFVRMKHGTRADDILCKLSINNHIVGLVHKTTDIRMRLMYHAACKVEFQPFKRLYSQLTF